MSDHWHYAVAAESDPARVPQAEPARRGAAYRRSATRAPTVAGAQSLLTNIRRGQIMGMAARVYCAADMVRRLPDDGNRYERVHGESLVTVAPRLWHQRIALRVARVLADYVDLRAVGEAAARAHFISRRNRAG